MGARNITQPISSLSHTEHAYNLIKEKIIQDELKQNTVVSVLSLVEELGVGRTPVTIACKQLEQDGFVKVIPKQGLLINPMTADDVRELYESRIAIEIFLAEKAFSLITEDDISVLELSIKKQKDCCEQMDPYAFMEEDTFFHRFLLEKHNNKTLMHMHHNLTDRIFFFGIRNSQNQGKIKHDIETHEAIVAAIKAQDKDVFLKELEHHYISAYSFMTSLQQNI